MPAPEFIKKSEDAEQTAFKDIALKLKIYIAADKAYSNATIKLSDWNLPVIASNDGELKDFLRAKAEQERIYADKDAKCIALNEARQELLLALPVRNLSFKLKVDGKDYLIRKELDQYEKETLVIE